MGPAEYAGGLMRLLDAEITSASDRLVDGQAPDFAAYRKAVGYIQGLTAARAIISNTFNEEHNAAG
jgi:hypothetical protein